MTSMNWATTLTNCMNAFGPQTIADILPFKCNDVQ